LYLDDITLGEALGGGAYGEVFEGLWQGVVKVAVKKLHDIAGLEEFVREGRILKSLRHPNIVSLFGIYMSPEKFPLIVTELMPLGNLRSFISKLGPSMIKLPHLVHMAKETSAGMLYLSSHQIVHRDLAARNLLVKKEEDTFTVKVADFGLSRKMEGNMHKSFTSSMPVRWSAPESFKERIFTTKSDSYSYGVVLFEMFTYGSEPWLGMSNHEVRECVSKGQQMNCPPDCPTYIYHVMLKCWNFNPEERPSFKGIFLELSQIEKDQGFVHEDRKSIDLPNEVEYDYGSVNDSTYGNSTYGNSTTSYSTYANEEQ